MATFVGTFVSFEHIDLVRYEANRQIVALAESELGPDREYLQPFVDDHHLALRADWEYQMLCQTAHQMRDDAPDYPDVPQLTFGACKMVEALYKAHQQ